MWLTGAAIRKNTGTLVWVLNLTPPREVSFLLDQQGHCRGFTSPQDVVQSRCNPAGYSAQTDTAILALALGVKPLGLGLHDSALFSSDFPIILLSSQTKLLSTTILQTTCPSIIQSTSAPATLLKFVLTKHPWLLYSWIQWTFSLNIIESFRPLYIFQWNSSILCLLWHCTHVSSLLPAYLAISSPFLCCVPSL